MSTVDAGQATEQQSEPTFEAGCKDEVSRNVQGTVDSTGLAQAWCLALHWQCEAQRKSDEYRRKKAYDAAMDFRVIRDAFASIQAEIHASLDAKDEIRLESGRRLRRAVP